MVSSSQYDVFLSHNSADQPEVECLAQSLREAGFEPFLDKWHLVPGEAWQEALEVALDRSLACAVFLGPAGLGTWENEEMRAALAMRADNPDFRVIPVLLPGARLPERGRLPRFLARYTWVDFRQGLDDAQAFHGLVCGIRGVAPGAAGAAGQTVCPFRGLQVFDEPHAPFFFGREALTQHLVEQLRDDRFLAVIGPSGSGKSSVVRAGLVPQVRAGALPGSERWPIVLLKPGTHPPETLVAHLLPYLCKAAEPVAMRRWFLSALRSGERGLHKAIQMALASAPGDLRLLLVVDQFEELFTLCQHETMRAAFVANLLYASAIAGGQMVAVITMRADFFGRCVAYPELATRLAERDVLVGPMNEVELRRVIESPGKVVGLHYEKGLVDTILDDLGDEPGMLPLLQHTLLELWERRRGGWLTTDAYHTIGGVKGALTQRADALYAQLTRGQQTAARQVLLRLTEPGEGTEDTRRRAKLEELLPAGTGADDAMVAVRRLADARLLTTSQDEEGHKVVDVSHEALIRGWPLLQGWIDHDRAALLTQRRLAEAAEEWESNGHNRSYLYRGARLVTAIEWAQERSASLNPREQQFLQASRRAMWRDRILTIGGLLLATALITVVTSLALTGQLNRWIYRPLPIDWVEVPAGPFVMGSTDSEMQVANALPVPRDIGTAIYNLSDEVPAHSVYLDGFEIGRAEVTCRQYVRCVRAGVCSPPSGPRCDDPASDDYPVTGVSWGDAQAFCEWNGGSLPTEAQWEKAARGPAAEPPRYPWGDDPDPARANVDGGALRPVGSYSPQGDSPYGIVDMCGNVWEWVLDWYARDYYHRCATSPVDNPAGPPEGDRHALRGGSYDNDWIQARSTHRNINLRPGDTSHDVGFRCAR